MRVIEVNIEHRQNEGVEETRDPEKTLRPTASGDLRFTEGATEVNPSDSVYTILKIKHAVSHPWRKMLTSAPVWAVILAHFADAWGSHALLAQLPSFLAGAYNLYSGAAQCGTHTHAHRVSQWSGSRRWGYQDDYSQHAPRVRSSRRECDASTLKLYRLRYPARRHPSYATFARLHQRSRFEGSTIVTSPNARVLWTRRTAAFDEDVLHTTHTVCTRRSADANIIDVCVSHGYRRFTVNEEQVGAMLSLPYFLMAVIMQGAGYLADCLQAKEVLSSTKVTATE
ncbi:hypothetical protein PR048_027432 [Dryococelus australis]|uniref:Uncharacterized protein n=1 Tax=Dryococelus australis TaxID=614101 RepID=A0ABQ9GFM0_9NEOP|nr:hypothetical protein PR048_027432 [Dryococelus australis]